VLRITVAAATSASPERVLARAGTEFSANRAKVWSNVAVKRLVVHQRGDTYAEVTEGATGIAWFAWERTRYDWSRPGIVEQTVLDSNVLEPGSIWELRVAPGEGGGSEVEMTLQRASAAALPAPSPPSSTTSPDDAGGPGICAAP
jgi:hypothetical protein